MSASERGRCRPFDEAGTSQSVIFLSESATPDRIASDLRGMRGVGFRSQIVDRMSSDIDHEIIVSLRRSTGWPDSVQHCYRRGLAEARRQAEAAAARVKLREERAAAMSGEVSLLPVWTPPPVCAS